MPRSTTLDAPAPRVRLARRIRPETVGVALALCGVAWLVVVPLGYLGWRGFTTGGDLTLEHLRDVFGVVGFGHIMGATTIFALGSAMLGLVTGGTLAFLFVRTDLPFRRVLLLVSLTPLLVPGILMTFAWIFLASPRAGILNGLLEPIVGPEALDVFGLPGMVFVESLRLAPIAMLVLAGALRAVDPSLEESAIVSGVGRLTVIRRVTLPVLRPAIGATGLLLTLLAIESFDVPVLLGIPGDVRVITSGIWASYQRSAGELGSVAAGGTLLLVLTVLGTMALAASTRGRQTVRDDRARLRHRPAASPRPLADARPSRRARLPRGRRRAASRRARLDVDAAVPGPRLPRGARPGRAPTGTPPSSGRRRRATRCSTRSRTR